MTGKKKKIIRYSIIAVVAIIIIMVILKKSGVISSEEAIKVSIETVQQHTIIETVSASGKVQPEVEVKISPDVSGELIELGVKEGDKVTKGQLLAKIKPDFYEASYEQSVASSNGAKANLANSNARLLQVKAQLINAKATYERNEKLWNQQVISAAEWDAAKSAYEVAKAELQASEQTVQGADYNLKNALAIVKQSKDNLNKTAIYAPVDGTISKLSAEKGERVVGASQFSAPEILRIANLNEMEVKVSVNENDIVRVHLGDTALIEVDAYLKRKFKGIVTSIANSANSAGTGVDQVTNFDVKIRILRDSYTDLIPKDNPNLSPFRPGMSATVDIQTAIVYNVISVPIQAVTSRDNAKGIVKDTDKKDQKMENDDRPKVVSDKNKQEKTKTTEAQEYVFVYENGKVKMTKVKTGIQDNTNIQIIEGLKEKQEVVSGPYKAVSKTLKDGDKVKKTDKKDLFSTKEKPE
ncbi:MAG: efflux RND transporter periplasmic adaptor subunit [Bacteroidota bacterium]